MENTLGTLVGMILKPFLIKMLPSLFEDFDKHECNFAIVELKTTDMILGTMVPFVKKHQQKWDIFEGVSDAPKVFGKAIDKDEALDMVKSIRFERHPKNTVVIATLLIDEIKEVKITYDNKDIWSLMRKNPKQLP